MRGLSVKKVVGATKMETKSKDKICYNPHCGCPRGVCALNYSPKQGINAVQMMEGSLKIV